MSSLPRIRKGLLRHDLEDQVLVYDTRDEKVHLLDRTTGAVVELLQEGGWTTEGIVAELNERFEISADQGLLLLAIDELRRVGLVDEVSAPEPIVDATRRVLLKKLAGAGAAAFLIPAVATLTSTKAYALGSAQLGNGSACTQSSSCISGLCCNGFCASTCGVGVGGACPNGNFQCTTNICCGNVCASRACRSVANCAPCQTSGECATAGQGCINGVCSDNSNKVANGQSCNGNGNCCSGKCVKVGSVGTCQA